MADHWQLQGTPDYISARHRGAGGWRLCAGRRAARTTINPDASALSQGRAGGGGDREGVDQPMVQRRLRINYNSAARPDRPDGEGGQVGPADHVGRREVLVDRDGVPA